MAVTETKPLLGVKVARPRGRATLQAINNKLKRPTNDERIIHG
jgi:hypothetical protein